MVVFAALVIATLVHQVATACEKPEDENKEFHIEGGMCTNLTYVTNAGESFGGNNYTSDREYFLVDSSKTVSSGKANKATFPTGYYCHGLFEAVEEGFGFVLSVRLNFPEDCFPEQHFLSIINPSLSVRDGRYIFLPECGNGVFNFTIPSPKVYLNYQAQKGASTTYGFEVDIETYAMDSGIPDGK